MGIDSTHLRQWIGNSVTVADRINPWPARALAATLDRHDSFEPGDLLPPFWHQLYTLAAAPASELGRDGHPRLGGVLPPVPLPRRMWAGGRVSFHRLLRVGDAVERRSAVADVTHKHGRSGELVFVLVRHEIHGPEGLAVTEEQDLVYREAAGPERSRAPARPSDAPPAEEALWTRTIAPDPVLLFRYSALTFSGHRIHYDRAFAAEEGYPGLVVHGPLLATLLLDLLRRHRPEATVTAFEFRALAPVFDGAPFAVNGRLADEGSGARLWVAGPAGELAMRAEATLAA